MIPGATVFGCECARSLLGLADRCSRCPGGWEALGESLVGPRAGGYGPTGPRCKRIQSHFWPFSDS